MGSIDANSRPGAPPSPPPAPSADGSAGRSLGGGGGVVSSLMRSGQPVGVQWEMGGWASDVEEADVAGVLGDEVLALLDVVAHEDAAGLVGQGGLLHVDPQQGAGVGVHGGRAELGPVHFAQALEPVELGLVVGATGQ